MKELKEYLDNKIEINKLISFINEKSRSFESLINFQNQNLGMKKEILENIKEQELIIKHLKKLTEVIKKWL